MHICMMQMLIAWFCGGGGQKCYYFIIFYFLLTIVGRGISENNNTIMMLPAHTQKGLSSLMNVNINMKVLCIPSKSLRSHNMKASSNRITVIVHRSHRSHVI